MGLHLGIDLGTTNSAMAVYNDETESTEIVENHEGDYTTPSVVQILEEDVLVGRSAVNQAIRHPDRTLSRTKRDMGTDTTYKIDETEYKPERIGGYVLEKLKTDAEESRGEPVDGAVVTVPYYFSDPERKATEAAGEFADLGVHRLMNEPTAACYAYGYETGDEVTLFVYDLGGGTFDATVVEVGNDSIDAQTSGGDKELGGENFDDELIDYVVEQIQEQEGPDPTESRRDRHELREDIKEAKELLTYDNSTVISYNGEDYYEVEVTAEKFQEMTSDLVDQTISIIDELFSDSDYEKSDMDEVLLVGGSTRMPHVRHAVQNYFEMEPAMDVNPDEVVAKGAALEAAIYDPDVDTEDDEGLVPINDVLSHSLGVEVQEDDGPNKVSPILTKDEEIPARNTRQYTNPTDEERTLIVRIIQGDEEQADHDGNTPLGEFYLEGVPADTTIDVTFVISEDGQLEVEAEAREKDIGDTLEITDGIGLSKQEIEDHEKETEDYEPSALQEQEDEEEEDEEN